MEYRDYREQSITYGNDQVGRFIFDGTYVRGPLDNATSAPSSLGQSVASLLLGLPNQSSLVARNDSYAERSPSWGFFIQDDWKVSRKLTIQMGLRLEFEQPMTERFNRSVRGLDDTYVQPFQAAAQAAYDRTLSPLLPAQTHDERRLDLRRSRWAAAGVVQHPKEEPHAALRLRIPTGQQERRARRLRNFLRFPGRAPRRRRADRIQPEHHLRRHPEQRGFHQFSVESVPRRSVVTRGRRTAPTDQRRAEHHLLRRDPRAALHAALAVQHPARGARLPV